jgi:cellulose biosynthesis protein BcsQ
MFAWWDCAWCRQLLDFLPTNSQLARRIIEGALVAAGITLITWLVRKLYLLFKRIVARIIRRDDCAWRLKRIRGTIDPDGSGLWLAIKRELPEQYRDWMSSLPFVMTVANDKGGVGKTTTTVNLAAAFAVRLPRPVLVLDLDPQGSASAEMFAGSDWHPREGQQSPASLAIDGNKSPSWLAGEAAAAKPFTWKNNDGETLQTPNTLGIGAFYELTETEDRMVTEWRIGDRLPDIRYNLFRLLRDPMVRSRFGAIFIDAPPRFSLSSVQALCASTHVLVPTILDSTSARAVGYFGKQLRRHEALWPRLKVIGILGTMSQKQRHEPGALRAATDALVDNIRGTSGELDYLLRLNKPLAIPYELSVPDRSSIGRTGGNGIAYNCLGDNEEGREVRGVFDGLAEELEERMR